MFAFTYVVHLFANEFAGLRGSRFTLTFVTAGALESPFFGHKSFH